MTAPGPAFDPIASPTVDTGPARERAFLHADDVATAEERLADYRRLYNLYLDPKETRSYLIRKLAYQDAIQEALRTHFATFRDHPMKRVVGLNV